MHLAVSVRRDWSGKDERDLIEKAAMAGAKNPKRPPIFLFVLESVRRSILTPDVAPHLMAFVSRNSLATETVSGSNATANSWYTIFHGRYPFYFNAALHRTEGHESLALRVLKTFGYHINVLTSTDLSFMGCGEATFGRGNGLIDSLVWQRGLSPPDADRKTIKALLEEIRQPSLDGQMYIVFLDSPHHDYSWPADFEPRFKPFAAQVNFVAVALALDSEAIRQVKNRYLNAVNFIDGLFGQVMDALVARGLTSSSIIGVVGDHGEEFMEKGHFTHASSLVEEQTTPPLALNVPGLTRRHLSVASQVDLMPSLLDALGLPTGPALFDGTSIFRQAATDATRLVSQNNNTDIPTEYALHVGSRKFYFQLILDQPSASAGTITLRYVTDADDRILPIPASPEERESSILSPFRTALLKLSFIDKVEQGNKTFAKALH